MSVIITEEQKDRVLEVALSGKLHKADYEEFVPKAEQLIKRHGKIRLLVTLSDFHGWDAGALWEDIKFDLAHFNDIERLAIVGETKWEKGMTLFCKPFTSAKVRYFEMARKNDAEEWILEESSP